MTEQLRRTEGLVFQTLSLQFSDTRKGGEGHGSLTTSFDGGCIIVRSYPTWRENRARDSMPCEKVMLHGKKEKISMILNKNKGRY